jgi:hypothetical protein
LENWYRARGVADDAFAADTKPTCKNVKATLPRVLDQISSSFYQKNLMVWSSQKNQENPFAFSQQIASFLDQFFLDGDLLTPHNWTGLVVTIPNPTLYWVAHHGQCDRKTLRGTKASCSVLHA